MSSAFRFQTYSTVVLFLGGLLTTTLSAAPDPPAGVPNFHQVNTQVYRGGQPTEQGFKNLAKLGIKTVINLRTSDELAFAEKKIVEAAGMRWINIPMKGMHSPTDEQIAKVLALFNDPSAGPVFVHCKRGADRTGTVVACYRIAHDRWDNQKALKEARDLGMGWMEFAMQHYILRFRPREAVAAAPSAPAPEPVPALAITQ